MTIEHLDDTNYLRALLMFVVWKLRSRQSHDHYGGYAGNSRHVSPYRDGRREKHRHQP